MDDQEDIGTLTETSGPNEKSLRTDIIYSKYCNNRLSEFRQPLLVDGQPLLQLSYPFAQNPPNQVRNSCDRLSSGFHALLFFARHWSSPPP